jgi:thiamine biosynthesis lipoprotein
MLLLQLVVHPPEMQRYEIRGRAQGTTYSVIYYATDSLFTKKECDSILRSLDSSLSIYQPYSQINQLNAAQRTFRADRHLAAVLRKGQKISRQTDGAFDLTILPLVQAWGFGARQHTQPPDSATVQQLKSCTGSNKLRLFGNKVIKKTHCIQVDVNGIAQGYSVDVLAVFMQRKGIFNYLAEIGGELRVRGTKQPSGEPMTIGIESPEAEDSYGAPLQRYLQVQQGAFTTSGNYRRYYLSGDKAISHLLDPRSGFPVNNELISVTVWAPDAITADAIDNALMVMGLEKALKFMSGRKNLEAYFIYKKNDGTVGDTATAGFYRFFKQD